MKKIKNAPIAGTITWLGILLIALVGCKDNATTDEALQANIIVSNECGIPIDVFMNGDYQFSLDYWEFNTIMNVALTTHELLAKWKGIEKVVLTDSVEVGSLSEHVWTVRSLADIIISNEYGETLNIYGDGSLQLEINDGESEALESIPYGPHVMEARKLDNTVVATITITIEENKEYTWTVSN